MGSMHLIAFFFIGIFHVSFAKECLDCMKQTDVTDPAVIQILSNKIKDVTPTGTENEEQAELVHIKEINRQVVKGLIYTFDFEARGLKSNSLYDCELVVFKQEWMGVEEIKEYNCKVVPAKENERSNLEEELLGNIENIFNPISLKKKGNKYVQCMKRAAIHCLL